jgi:hypothetical protein
MELFSDIVFIPSFRNITKLVYIILIIYEPGEELIYGHMSTCR